MRDHKRMKNLYAQEIADLEQTVRDAGQLRQTSSIY